LFYPYKILADKV
jgi:putative addiction module killer protein/probable addiction module antidote protein